MRTLAIDPGEKRIGLALSDAGGTLASPYEVIEVASMSAGAAPIVNIASKEGVEQIVVGLPLNMDGSAGLAARKVLEFGMTIATAAKLPVVYIDERLSSFAAENSLKDRIKAGEKLTRGQKKRRLDALAAAGFLQEFLDHKIAPLDVHSLF